MTRDEMIHAVQEWPRHKGKGQYLRHLQGEQITQKEAILAMCFSCCGGEPDICNIEICPLNQYHSRYFKNALAVAPPEELCSDLNE